MGAIKLGALSEDSWVTGSLSVADYLMSHFFEADYSQTAIYNGSVSSMAWVVHESQGDVTKTLTLLQSTLQRYFSGYFEQVTVDTTDVTNELTPSKIEISLYLSFVDEEGKSYTLAKMAQSMDSKFYKLVDLNNNGTGVE
jgi:hypothetical protein